MVEDMADAVVGDERPPSTLAGLLAESVDRFGERNALITVDEHITYSQLESRVRGIARSLVAAGAGKGTRVGLLMENHPDWVATALAVTGLGALLVPISTFSRADDLEYMINHADVQVLLMSAGFLANDYSADLLSIAPELGECEAGGLYSHALPTLRTVVVRGAIGGELPSGCIEWDSFLASGDGVPESTVEMMFASSDPEEEAYLLTTSGTTARPKGVLLTHHALALNGHQIGDYQGLVESDVVWAYFPLFFSAGCINVMLGTLSHGAALIVQSTFDPGEALELIDRERATTWHLWPHQLTQLTQHPNWDKLDHGLLHKGTGPYDLLLSEPPADGMGGVNMYGMTETSTAFSCTRASESAQIRLGSQGHLLWGNQIKIVDPDTGEHVVGGDKGEICVKGPTLMRRYHKVDPRETFDADGWFRTGDLGWVDDEGRIHFEQRIKDVIKTGGINVSPADIEAKLTLLPGVKDAYAFGMEDADRGEVVGAALVVDGTFVNGGLVDGGPPDGGSLEGVSTDGSSQKRVSADGSSLKGVLDEESILAKCSEDLPGYKRPRAFLLVRSDSVPMTGSGKVQKFAMRDQLVELLAANPEVTFHYQ